MKNIHVGLVLILIFYISAVVLHHIFGYMGHFGYDDLHYAKLSTDLLNGSIDFDDHYSFRFPIIVLTSFMYRLFGISDFSSSLPALLITVFILFIVYLILRNDGLKRLSIGLGLVTFSNWILFYSDKLMPDIYVALAVVTSMYILYAYKFRCKPKRPILYSSLFVACLLFGFMAKGTIILMLPLLVYFLVIDTIYRRDMEFWKYTSLIGCVVLLVYFAAIGWLTGNIFQRFEAIGFNSYLNSCSYDQQPILILIKRIGYQFYTMAIQEWLFTGFIFLIPLIGFKKISDIFKMEDKNSFFLISSWILLLSANFMTISPTAYSPMCLDPRHYLFLIPIVAVPASAVVTHFIETKERGRHIIVVLLIISIISFFGNNDICWRLYAPLLIVFFAYNFLIKPKAINQSIFTILFIVILFLGPLEMISYSRSLQYNKQKEIFFEQILDRGIECTLVTNDVQSRLGKYYDAFDGQEDVRFIKFEDFESDFVSQDSIYLMLNWYTRYLSNIDLSDFPLYVRHIHQEGTPIYKNDELDISIYSMNYFSASNFEASEIITSFNDFENPVSHWTGGNGMISNKVVFEGKYAYEFLEYSSTFEYAWDTLGISSSERLSIICDFKAYIEDQRDSRVVISIENEEGAYYWKSFEFDKSIKAYANWWPIHIETEIDKGDIKNRSRLRIYIWNRDKQISYVDNFNVRLLKISF